MSVCAGEGRFGKVYECFNLSTGEINAVKQISIQERDTNAIQAIIDEISNFQRLNNDYVVKFYGAEVHHVSMTQCGVKELYS